MDKDYPIVDLSLTVSSVRFFTDTLFEVKLTSPTPLPKIHPGQFVQVQVPGRSDVFLRRPISIYKHGEYELSLLIQVVGKGTAGLAEAKPGDHWQVLLPLGNHFREPSGQKPLLVGGGVGIAPLLELGNHLKAKGIPPTFLLGARSSTLFPELDEFESLGRLFITTEDDSRGEPGYVTDHSILHSEAFTDVYTCGPTPMMKAVAKWSKAEGLPCQASLENLMACGMGVCLCCVEPTVAGHKSVCTDGPIFDVNELLW